MAKISSLLVVHQALAVMKNVDNDGKIAFLTSSLQEIGTASKERNSVLFMSEDFCLCLSYQTIEMNDGNQKWQHRGDSAIKASALGRNKLKYYLYVAELTLKIIFQFTKITKHIYSII